ncbi:hypothetical protein HIM_11021 [Hirsutella minnesotensis 3608]|uniref:EKC/KEOPS complex subunit BUD32 n=1 Tax=Hirsutella minnesotensis 3608 TaxID=1043627 RepID=A0A0F8A1N6_9HYPO|nr:hypothetical protein HIM_11021 [Hirsutella minnesotensis 3608]
MTLAETFVKIITERPLKEALDPLRERLHNSGGPIEPKSEDIADLLGVLVASPAAFSLPDPDGSGNVAVKLFFLQQRARAGAVQAGQFRALFASVIDNESTDVDIWEAVFTIIESLDALSPPSSIAPTFKGTPVKPSSSRLGDSETRDIVEGELFFEIRDCTFRNVSGFWDRFFDSKRWRKEQKAMLQKLTTAHDGKKWTDFPNPSDEQPVWEWFRALERDYLVDARQKLHTTKTANQFKERKGQMDLFFQPARRKADEAFWYKHVLVVGEQKKSHDTSRFKADLLQITRHVRSVFADQPTRRFVHAFTLCASVMELWVFDRSGPYSSGPFDVHKEPDKFARALVGYATMDDDAMGLDMFIERKNGLRYITLDDANGGESRIRLTSPMMRQKAVVCRGTTCFMTRNRHVAKFSWASDKRELEFKQLKLAEERGVKGVAKAVAHRRITTIAELRKGLVFADRHRFRSDVVHLDDASASASTNSSSQKRKSSSDIALADDTSEPKRLRSNRNKSSLMQTVNKQLSINKRKPSLYSTGEDPWDNRIYVCLVVSPAGRVISDFESTKELLEAMRDAIRAHQSLYVTGNILHRDISSNNIVITKPETADGFKGMLIDLDLAKVANTGPSGARHRTGTMQFMAVEVLRQADHTYRHDLESFFYVLLWMCARESWSKPRLSRGDYPPKSSLLRKWEIGSFQDIADAKEGHMTVNSLERITKEFPEALDVVKPLCLRIRSILFGDTARLHFGTPTGEPCKLYQPVIAAFNEALDKIS